MLQADVRRPRFRVTVNGVVLQGVLSAEVTNASHFSADTFRVEIAASGVQEYFNATYWALSDNDQISISVGFADVSENISSVSQLILGQCDEIDYDPVKRIIIISGRDLSAPLMDMKSSEKFQNLTSSQIAQQLALRHGLDSQVQATTKKAGSYYENDFVTLNNDQPEWDLLVYLAGQEGFDCWVSGTTLFFQPSLLPSSTPYKIICPSIASVASNAVDVHLSRSQTLAKDVIVRVYSWNQRNQARFHVEAHATKAFKSQRGGGKAQIYSYTIPNLSKDQAQQKAQSLLADITRHERVLTATLPGDNDLSTRRMVRLVGSGTAWDQDYYPDTVTRHLSTEGYRMELRAKNHSAQSTVII